MKVIKILASTVTALDSNVYTGGGTDYSCIKNQIHPKDSL